MGAPFRMIPETGRGFTRDTLHLVQSVIEGWGRSKTGVLLSRTIADHIGFRSKARPDAARALCDWVRARVRYFSDPYSAEMVGDPLFVLEHGGDCDDMTALLGALLHALGHDVHAVAVRWQGRQHYTHCALWDASTRQILDPVAKAGQWPPEGYVVADAIKADGSLVTAALSGFFDFIVDPLGSSVGGGVGGGFGALGKAIGRVLKPIRPALDPLGIHYGGRNFGTVKKAVDKVVPTALSFVPVVGTALSLATRAVFTAAQVKDAKDDAAKFEREAKAETDKLNAQIEAAKATLATLEAKRKPVETARAPEEKMNILPIAAAAGALLVLS